MRTLALFIALGFLGLVVSASEQAAQPSLTKPKAISRADPVFPFGLFTAGTSGSAVIEYTVDTQGKVVNPKVVSATHPDFGRSALDCITRWKFEPGKKDGRPVSVRMQLEFAFDNPKKKRSDRIHGRHTR